MRASLKAGLTVLGLSALPLAAHADVIGFEAGGAYWNQDPSGWVQDEQAANSADIVDDLGIDDEGSGFFWAAVEHPFPLLPNVKLKHSSTDMSGAGTIESLQFSFEGVTFSRSEEVNSSLQLDQTDLILYYEVLDNIVSLDVGANVKFLDGQVRVEDADDATRSTELDFSSPVPMLYGRALAGLPLTGFSIGAEVSGIGYSGSSFIDAQAFLRYEVVAVGVEAGYRRVQLELDDIDDVSADITIDGPYLGVYADF